ncbi:hypothetical protein RsTz2092_09660 [Deferribacterales bacterium RsTz2092]
MWYSHSAFTATGALAADVAAYGDITVKGISRANANFSAEKGSGVDADRAVNWGGLYEFARIGAKVNIDDKTLYTFRIRLQRGQLGNGAATYVSNANTTGNANTRQGNSLQGLVDTAWVQYKFTNDLAVTTGFSNPRAYYRTFGGGFYDNAPGDTAGSFGFIDAGYKLGIGEVYVAYETAYNDANGDNKSNANLYVLGAAIKNGSLGIYPAVTYFNDQNTRTYKDDPTTIIGAYVAAEYLPAAGVQAKGAVAFTTFDSKGWDDTAEDYVAKDETAGLFGVYADVAYVTDKFTAGFTGAYGSYDKKTGKAFWFGGDWNKAAIADAGMIDGDGIGGMTALYLYADVKPIDALKVSVVGAQFISNVDKDYGLQSTTQSKRLGTTLNSYKYVISDKSKITEFDIVAKYSLTKATYLEAGVAYAKYADIYTDAYGDYVDSIGGSDYEHDADATQLWLTLGSSF